MNSLSICVLGGSGFVGTELANLGHKVKILTRRRERNRKLLVLPTVHIVETDVQQESQLKQLFKDCDVVINLIGILNESGRDGSGFYTAHVELTRKVICACSDAKVPRLLHMSALNAGPDEKSFYLRTKGEAENYVHTFAANRVAVTSFRPSVIFGPKDSFMNRFASILKFTPLIFPLACANVKFAPVYVGDVVNSMINAINDSNSIGKRINLCGPKQYTLKDLVNYVVSLSGKKIAVLSLPDSVSKIQAYIFEFLPGKPFSLDNYRSLQKDSICHGTKPCTTTLESIVPTYLGKK